MRQGYGSGDSDKVGKETRDKRMVSPGEKGTYTGVIGGVGNAPRKSDAKSGATMNFACGGKVAPYNPGGFRNAAMEHKR